MATEHTIEGTSGEISRKVWIIDPPKREPDHFAIFLDGEFYLERMNAPAIIEALQNRGDIPSMVSAFVSHVDGAARHRDLTCNGDYTDFVAHDIMQWMHQRHPTTTHGDHFIGGTSLGGLAAAYIALSHPGTFSRCLSQSGSFWWNDEWLTSQVDRMPDSKTRFWSSVGDRETEADISHNPSGLHQKVSQISACDRFAEALSARQFSVHHHLYSGGHEFGPWQNELPDAFRWLFTD